VKLANSGSLVVFLSLVVSIDDLPPPTEIYASRDQESLRMEVEKISLLPT